MNWLSLLQASFDLTPLQISRLEALDGYFLEEE